MEEIKIFYKKEVEIFFNEFIYDLYSNDYFGYLESAIEYKDRIIQFIEDNIVFYTKKRTPSQLSYLGNNYFFYKINNNTTWFIFFEYRENTYLITDIFNNHNYLAKFLNSQ